MTIRSATPLSRGTRVRVDFLDEVLEGTVTQMIAPGIYDVNVRRIENNHLVTSILRLGADEIRPL